jgi:hypothetical protein
MFAFVAKGVAATVINDAECVVLAEDPDGADGPRLEIMRGLNFDEQERRLGLDTYSLSTQTGATIHGGVVSYSLDDSILTMRLEPRARDTLGVPSEFSIRLEADAVTIARVRAALVSILGDAGGTLTK